VTTKKPKKIGKAGFDPEIMKEDEKIKPLITSKISSHFLYLYH